MKRHYKTKKTVIKSQKQKDLHRMVCPRCKGSLEGMQFGGSNGREGGFGYCKKCNIQFAWIDKPFECEEKDGNPDRGWLPDMLDTRKPIHAGYMFGGGR